MKLDRSIDVANAAAGHKVDSTPIVQHRLSKDTITVRSAANELVAIAGTDREHISFSPIQSRELQDPKEAVD